MFKIFEETLFVGRSLIYLPKCRSTNDIASDMANKKALKDGSIIITDYQYAGKGQRGNIWEAEPEKNLVFSIYLEPHFLKPPENFLINLISSLSIQEALSELDSLHFTIKWPNDIMFRDRKIGGILIENKSATNQINHAVIGIGVNINQTDFNPAFKATSLRNIFKRDFDRNMILNRIIHHLDLQYSQLKEGHINQIKKKYTSRLFRLNSVHSFLLEQSNETFEGTIQGIDELGRLKVWIGGRESIFNFKEITYLE